MKVGTFVMGTRTGTYRDILDQIQYAEELSFDGVWLGERHFHHSDLLYPSPFSVAAAIAAKTSRIRIGTAAKILPLDHPIHVAEDAATLDILSGGRLDLGVTRAGLDEEFHHAFHAPLEETRGRFQEALEVILKAWITDRFSYDGKYYKIPEVSVHPKPLQKPHPPIYVVAISPETIRYAAGRGYPIFVGAIQRLPDLKRTHDLYWQTYKEAGHNGTRVALPVNRFLYVGETDRKAWEEMEGPFMAFINEKAPDLKAALCQRYGEGNLSFDRFLNDFCIFGSPDTCIAKIKELEREIGLKYLLCTLNYVTMDHALCLKSMERFAKFVMPSFKGASRKELISAA
ncbi:MAG: LLM class flavin-dependent oxidoreductase [candidate division NC10 bacterium]|nr:LLM class flavin-dependent oxidoreductase [candidate division NC10 bacterium]